MSGVAEVMAHLRAGGSLRDPHEPRLCLVCRAGIVRTWGGVCDECNALAERLLTRLAPTGADRA